MENINKNIPLIILDISSVGTQKGINRELIKNIIDKTNNSIYIGGGIKDENDLKDAYNLGAQGVLIATAVHKGILNLKEIIEKYKDKLSKDELKKLLIDIVSETRYGKSGYFWINDTTPKMIMHPIKPSLNGKDLSGVKDPNGVYLFVEMAKIASKNGEGIVEYHWPKPGSKKPILKVSPDFEKNSPKLA